MNTSSVKMLRTILKGALAASCMALLLASPAFGGGIAVVTPTYSAAATTQYPLPIPMQPTVATTFTSWFTAVPVPYATGTFTVAATGSYTATLSTSPVIDNAIFLLTGVFSPNAIANPTTPLGNFFAGTQSLATTTIPSVTLTAGTQYSYLLLAAGASGTFTFTLTGPGDIYAGPAATTPINPLAILPVMIAALGVLVLLKKPSMA